MLSELEIQNCSISSMHKLIVIKNSFLNKVNFSEIEIIIDKLFVELKLLLQQISNSNEHKSYLKDLIYGFQVLYKLLSFIFDNQLDISNDYKSHITNSIYIITHELIRDYLELLSIDCLVTLTLIVVITLKSEFNDDFLQIIDDISNTRFGNINHDLLNLFLLKYNDQTNYKFGFSLYLAILSSFSFLNLIENNYLINLIEFINRKSPRNYDESILKSMFFRKLCDIISINKEHEKTMEISEYLIDHAFDQQFIKQTSIRNNTTSVLSSGLSIHLNKCQKCSRTVLCRELFQRLLKLFQQSWNVSGKFSFINIFIRVFSGEVIRKIEPKIELILLQTAQEYSLSTYACDSYISLLTASNNSSIGIELIVEIFHRENPETSFSNIDSIRKTICEYFVPKLTQENCGKLTEIVFYALKCYGKSRFPMEFSGDRSSLKKLIVFSTHHLLYLNNYKKIDSVTRERILGSVLNEGFVEEASVDWDENVRMEMFAILCKEISRQNQRNYQLWNQILRFLISNLSIASNKLRQHFVNCFRQLVNGIIRQNIDSSQAVSTEFLAKLLRYLSRNLYPIASFYKRSSFLAVLNLIFNSFDSGIIFDLLDMSDAEYVIFLKTLVYFFADTFEENRMNASKCFIILVNTKPLVDHYESLKQIALEKSNTSNPHDCAVAFTIMKTLLGIEEYKLLPHVIADQLIARLECSLESIKSNIELFHIAMNSPFYSSLYCLRYLLDEHFENISSQLSVTRIISLCYAINDVIFPFNSSAAPEGCLPDEVRNLLDSHFVESHPEYLTICCWRSCKEISLILGNIAAELVNKSSDNFNQVQQITDFFFDQITSVTHKGAFESLCGGFEKLCQSLWRSSTMEIVEIPMSFIRKSIDIIHTNEDLCSTRRSAGLPHLFLVLITSEPLVNKQRSSLNFAMDQLNSILVKADSQNSADQKRIIHIFNISRLLFKESSLLTQLINHTFSAVKYSVQFFSSNIWPLRNSATLLYCALIERIFGPSKTIKFHNKFNRLNSKVFFNRYQNMYEFIVNTIKECDKSPLNLNSSTRIYPILVILGRLVPELDHFNSSSYDLTYLKHKIQRYLSSSVWVIRVSAAKAIAALALGESVLSIDTIRDLTQQIIDCPRNHNLIHGSIKAIRCIFEDLLDNLFISDNQWALLRGISAEIWNRLSPVILSLRTDSRCPQEFIDLIEFIHGKSSKFLEQINFNSYLTEITSLWQVKLLFIALESNRIDEDMKYVKGISIGALQNAEYKIRKEMLIKLSLNPEIINKIFPRSDIDLIFHLACSESHPSVDLLCYRFLDQFISAHEISSHSFTQMLSVLIGILQCQSSIRTKKFCILLELVGSILHRWIPSDSSTSNQQVCEYLESYLQLISANSKYETDVEIRISCAESLRRCLQNADWRDYYHGNNTFIEIAITQLSDENDHIRNLAALSVAIVLQMPSLRSIVPSAVLSKYFKLIICGSQSNSVRILSDLSPIGYQIGNVKYSQGKISVFDSEEINFYYDFYDVHSDLKLDLNQGNEFLYRSSFQEILLGTSKFSSAYQNKLLNR